MEGGYKTKDKKIIFIFFLLLLINLLCLFALAQEVSSIPISYRINFIALGKKVKYDLEIEEGVQKHLLVNILNNEVKEILPAITWDRTYGGSGNDEAWTLIQTTDGGYAVAGRTQSKGTGGADFWVIKLDEQGNLK